jgi:hypothetical protein
MRCADPIEALNIGADRDWWVEHRKLGQHLLVIAGALGEAVADLVVGKQGAAAVGVVDDGGFEVRAVGGLGFHQIADVGDVLDNGRRYAPADGAGDDRFTELEAEKFRRIDPGNRCR